jgi:folate-binding protein YgfZ
MPVALLPDRAVVRVAGPDARKFLQGLVSNDVTGAAPVWSALLTPQGKWLHDFFVVADGEALVLETPAARAEDLAARLKKFRLRAKVELAVEPATVAVGWGGAPMPPGAWADPRLPAAGWRHLGALPADAGAEVFDLHRLALGLPDGVPDLEPEKSILLEAGFDELRGISWSKGCFMGQELTARTRYRGLVKKRLLPVAVEGPLPPPGARLMQGEAEAGEMRGGRGALGLALLRLDAVERGTPITFDSTVLTPRVPDWVVLPQPKAA